MPSSKDSVCADVRGYWLPCSTDPGIYIKCKTKRCHSRATRKGHCEAHAKGLCALYDCHTRKISGTMYCWRHRGYAIRKMIDCTAILRATDALLEEVLSQCAMGDCQKRRETGLPYCADHILVNFMYKIGTIRTR